MCKRGGCSPFKLTAYPYLRIGKLRDYHFMGEGALEQKETLNTSIIFFVHLCLLPIFLSKVSKVHTTLVNSISGMIRLKLK